MRVIEGGKESGQEEKKMMKNEAKREHKKVRWKTGEGNEIVKERIGERRKEKYKKREQ